MLLAAIRSRFAPLRASPAVSAPSATPLDATAPDETACVTCGRPADTPFCPHCGERRAADRVYTLHALAAEVWDHVTPADGRVLRSGWTLVRRPGALTTAYMSGVRQPYLTPLGVFFAVNAAYFVFVGATRVNTFTTPLRVHIGGVLYKSVARRMVRGRLVERHLTFDTYAQRFDAAVAVQAKSLVGAMVPEFAVLIAAVQWRHRRPLVHHLSFAFHTTAVFLVVLMGIGVVSTVALAAAEWGFGYRLTPQGTDDVTSLAVVAVFATWLAVGFRRAYGDGRFAGALKAAVVAVLTFAVVVSGYRALLFFTTFWTT